MVYIVDDSVDYRFLVQQVFKLFLSQYALRLFADGLDLIQVIEQGTSPQPNLIILDIDMPKLNGYQTLERLKQKPLWQAVPVVMMSNRVDVDFIETAYRLGANAYLTKPMDIAELRKVMEQLCQQWLNGTSANEPEKVD